MTRRSLGVVVLAAAALAGCGGSSTGDARRAAVNSYIDRVDRAEAGLVGSSGQIDRAFAGFRLSGNSAAEVQQLRFARDRVAAALARVRAIRPPAEARRLHMDVVGLLALQRAAAAELLGVVTYQPRFERALAPLAGAGKGLARDIRQAAKAKAPPAPSSSGAAVWAKAGCGTCHTLAAAGSNGTTGPDLDVLRLAPAQVAAQVRTGGGGMPSFAKRLSPGEIGAVATFVSSAEERAAASTGSLDAYAAAFDRYQAALEGIVKQLEVLDAPPVLRPTHEAELRTLRRAAALSGTVGSALERRDVAAANDAIRRLFATAASAGRGNTHRAAAAAVRAYNRRLRQIGTLSARITRERQRLVQQIG